MWAGLGLDRHQQHRRRDGHRLVGIVSQYIISSEMRIILLTEVHGPHSSLCTKVKDRLCVIIFRADAVPSAVSEQEEMVQDIC